MIKAVGAFAAGAVALTTAATVSFGAGFGAGYGTGVELGVGVGYCAGGGSIPQQVQPTPTPSSIPSGDPRLAVSSTFLGASTNTVLWKAIAQAANGNNRLTLAMLFGSWIESRWSNNGSNADGAWGAWRIQQPVGNPTGTVVNTDITVAQALDLVYSTNYMLPRYRNGVKKVPENLWHSDPAAAAAMATFYAENPAVPYAESQGQATVNQAYRAAVAVMGTLGGSVDFTQPPPDSSGGGTNCSSSTTGGSSKGFVDIPTGSYRDQRSAVVTAAYSAIGTKYSFAGGNAQGPTLGACTNDAGWNDCNIVGFDCSGLVLWAFAKVHISFPHVAASQYQMTQGFTVARSMNDLTHAQPGDLVFFEGAAAPGHVAIYVGNGDVIQAPQSGELVKKTPLSQMSPFTAITDPFAWAAAQKKSA